MSNGIQFFCDKVFTFEYANTARCSFQGSATFISYDVKYFDPNMWIALSPQAPIRALCSPGNQPCLSTIVNSNSKVFLAMGSNPVRPRLQIKSTASIGKCEDLSIDLTSSTGNAGREWKSTTVNLKTGIDIDASNITAITIIFQSKLSTTSPIVISRGMLMTSRYPYELTFTMCNIFDRCGSGVLKVNVTDSSEIPPCVEIAGSSERTMTRPSSLSLTSFAYVAQCSTGSSSNKVSGQALDIQWQVWETFANGSALLTKIQSTSKDKMKLVLGSYSFNAKTIYEVKVIAKDKSSGLSTTKSVMINVISSELVAVLNPQNGFLLLRSGDDPLQIDGLASYDPDISSRRPMSEDDLIPRFAFRWTCIRLDTKSTISNEALLGKIKEGFDVNILSNECPLFMTTSGSRIFVSSVNESAIDSVSAIILTITDTSIQTAFARSSSAIIQIKVIAADAPLVSINTAASVVNKVNVKNRVFLYGSVVAKTACFASWSVDNGLELSAISVAAFTKYIPVNIETPINLVLMNYGLPAIQASYVFRLTCGSSSSSIYCGQHQCSTYRRKSISISTTRRRIENNIYTDSQSMDRCGFTLVLSIRILDAVIV
jgi:hypothetical protein